MQRPSLITLILLISFASVGALLYTPALPAISKHFGISTGMAQLTVTVYLIGYALGQLPYGPLSNRWGRKRTIYFGCALGFLGSVLCIVANGWLDMFWLLNIGRVISALGMSVGLVLTFTIIGDAFEEEEARKVISIAILSFSIMPGIAVAVGGFLTEYIGWQACFYFQAIYVLLIWWVASRLPETGGAQVSHLRDFWKQWRNPLVVMGGSIMGIGTGIVYIFGAKAPFIGQKIIGLSPGQYGLLNLVPTIGFVLGCWISSMVAKRLKMVTSVIFGLVLMIVAATVQLILFGSGVVTSWTLAIPIAFLFFGAIFEYSAISAAITAGARDKSNASAVMSFLNMGFATVGVLLASVIFPNSALAMPLFFVILVGLMGMLFAVLRRVT